MEKNLIMGKTNEGEAKKRTGPKGRVHHKAGLQLPASKYKKEWRNTLPGHHRLEKNVIIKATAYAQFLMSELIKEAAANVGDGVHIKPEHVYLALNSESFAARGAFPKRVGGFHY